ncbi:hypothetical protein I546_5779 [Mycobacterium kansasii 732]|uniref:Uncharacterized protein n=1 Tax=Mycobacterium pseudokansasii TaxID=2341080 RepID=A0A498QZU8_9MYCO|nr:hypothetical protein [Mycobacterium kansasii]EUA06183.1 hypothetical protein I546_5779 [Mycobacterium kansasii 732]VBA33981.1 hypothetical protein LAUMK35_05628 [Mycobacterium pseudokansasii]VBA35464.1 hypothetical protein LAUMK21_05588 [Mycobacterium pseudokansasii]VBA56563.1 hypothetical protein LAUMK142_05588 [Mycobacterium pseudokansasii]
MAVKFAQGGAGYQPQPFTAGLIEPAKQPLFGVLQGLQLAENGFDDRRC